MFARALSVLRPLDWVHFLLFPAAGAVIGGASFRHAVLAVGVGALLLAQAYAHNEYCDAVGSFDSTSASPDWSPWWHRVPLVLAAALLLWLSPVGRSAAVAFACITLLYSGGPRLKRFPFLGTALNGLGFALLCGLALDGWHADAAWLMGMAAFWVVAAQLVHEEQDASEDRRDGIRTTAQVLGPRWNRVVLVGALLAAAAAGGCLEPRLGVGVTVYTLGVAWAARTMDPGALRRGMKWFGVVVAAFLGVLLWWPALP